MSVRKFLRIGLNKLGLNITRMPPPHFLSHHVRDFVRRNDINLVMDVGAYHGFYCDLLRREAGYTGLIASFEPCAGSFEKLHDRMCNDPNWVGFQYGLSDVDGSTELITYGERGDFNSVLPLRETAATVYGVDRSIASIETVRMFKIDTVWSELTKTVLSPRVLLKMDTQGRDVAVVLGARNHINSILGIQSEIPVVEIYDGMTSMPDAIRLYRDLSFVPIGFFPVNTPTAYGVSPEFDVLFKRFKQQAG